MTERQRIFVGGGGVILLIFLLVIITIPYFLKISYSAPSEEKFASANIEEIPVAHISTPEPLKALYMTACVAGTPKWRESLKDLIEKTELNAAVIDIKDYTGSVSFRPDASCYVKDMKDFISRLHESGVYVIGRISVFQDVKYSGSHPDLAVKSKASGGVWKDRKGISFIDVGARPYWDYIVEISKEAYAIGFDELNFDYIRYPSDGNMEDAEFTWSAGTSTKPEMLEGFFSYLKQNLNGTGIVTSADIFGMTTTVYSDMGIGQVLERALPYFDYVAPMVYPSHYPAGWNGLSNPAEFPYDVVKISMSEAKRREEVWKQSHGIATSTPTKLRTWIQDFHLGATYDSAKVRAQIQATYDSGLTSWMLWSAANKYTDEALLPN